MAGNDRAGGNILMPMRTAVYPPYWAQFSVWIRRHRAKGLCEQCGAPNGRTVNRGFLPDGKTPVWHCPDSGRTFDADNGAQFGEWRSYELVITRETRIVLTVAHLENLGDVCQCLRITGFKCANPKHVRALCQRCHLAYDRAMHVRRRRQRRIEDGDRQRGLLREQL